MTLGPTRPVVLSSIGDWGVVFVVAFVICA